MTRTVLACAAGLALAAVSLLPADAAAQRYTSVNGEQLVALCSSRDKAKVEQCTVYVDALSDAATFYQELLPRDGSKGGRLPAYICVPASTTGTALREAVVAYAGSHQQALKVQASGLVLRALRDKFPCS